MSEFDESDFPTGEYLNPGWEELRLDLNQADPPVSTLAELRAQIEKNLELLKRYYGEFLPGFHLRPPPKGRNIIEEEIKLQVEKVKSAPLEAPNIPGEDDEVRRKKRAILIARYLDALDNFLARAGESFIQSYDKASGQGVMLRDYKKNVRYGSTLSDPDNRILVVNLHPAVAHGNIERIVSQISSIREIFDAHRFTKTEQVLTKLMELE